MFHILWEL